MKSRRLVRAETARAAHALTGVIDETRRLFHRLKLVAEALHAADSLTAGERGVLFELAEHGPRSVPQMARVRPVSRQHIQTHVNALLDRSLVERADNPRHLRSKLIRLTGKGSALAAKVKAREARVLTDLGRRVDRKELDRAAETLRKVNALFQEPE